MAIPPDGSAAARSRLLRSWLLAIVLTACLGWALGHFAGDPPYRALAWDEELLTPLLSTLGWSWEAWVSDLRVDACIGWLSWILGGLFLLSGAAALWRPSPVWLLPLLAGPLLLLGLARWSAHAWDPIWPLEFALRACVPLLLWQLTRQTPLPPLWLRRLLLAACMATFAGHACYALDWFPTPGPWPELVQRATGLQGAAATMLLHGMATWDLLLVAAVCWPRSRRSALLGMAAWGGMTALARLLMVDPLHLADTLPLALGSCLERLPHAAIPALLWLLLRSSSTGSAAASVPDSNPSPA